MSPSSRSTTPKLNSTITIPNVICTSFHSGHSDRLKCQASSANPLLERYLCLMYGQLGESSMNVIRMQTAVLMVGGCGGGGLEDKKLYFKV